MNSLIRKNLNQYLMIRQQEQAHFTPPPNHAFRITDEGDRRETDNGDLRIVETA